MNKPTDDSSKKHLEKLYAIFDNYSIDMDHIIAKEKINDGIKKLDVFELMELDESVRRYFECTKHYTSVLKYNLREVLDKEVVKASDIIDVYGQVVKGFEGRELSYEFFKLLTFIRFCSLFDIPYEPKENKH